MNFYQKEANILLIKERLFCYIPLILLNLNKEMCGLRQGILSSRKKVGELSTRKLSKKFEELVIFFKYKMSELFLQSSGLISIMLATLYPFLTRLFVTAVPTCPIPTTPIFFSFAEEER